MPTDGPHIVRCSCCWREAARILRGADGQITAVIVRIRHHKTYHETTIDGEMLAALLADATGALHKLK